MTDRELRKSITKLEVNSLPLISFQGKIHVISDNNARKDAISYLRNQAVLGFDTESRPAFSKGESYDISLLQLSTKDHAFLFRLNKISFHNEILEILTEKKILKVGVAIRDDIKGLQKLSAFSPNSFVEIAELAASLKIKNLGLRNLAAICFSKRISKNAKLSNWENDKLTDKQKDYAATDAWIGLELYEFLLEYNKG